VTPATIEAARAAKERLADLLDDVVELSGLGIAIVEGGFGVKVNLITATSFPIPSVFDGVPVVVDIVGDIYPL